MDTEQASGPRASARVKIVAGVVTILVGFGAGFVLGTRPSGTDLETAATASTTSTAAAIAPTPSTAATSTARPTVTTSTTASVTTTAVPTTPAPTTTVSPSTTVTTRTTPPPAPPPTAPVTVPTTPRPRVTEAPPSTAAPAHIQARYVTNAAGRLVIPRVGSAVITLTNDGGESAPWILTGTGFSTGPGGTSQGTLGPGQSTAVRVFAPAKKVPPNTLGKLVILGAVNPNVAFIIP